MKMSNTVTDHSLEAVCDVCDRRGYGGHMGIIRFSDGLPWSWYPPARRLDSHTKRQLDKATEPPAGRTVTSGVWHAYDVPGVVECPSEHRLRTAGITDRIVKAVELGQERFRILE